MSQPWQVQGAQPAGVGQVEMFNPNKFQQPITSVPNESQHPLVDGRKDVTQAQPDIHGMGSFYGNTVQTNDSWNQQQQNYNNTAWTDKNNIDYGQGDTHQQSVDPNHYGNVQQFNQNVPAEQHHWVPQQQTDGGWNGQQQWPQGEHAPEHWTGHEHQPFNADEAQQIHPANMPTLHTDQPHLTHQPHLQEQTQGPEQNSIGQASSEQSHGQETSYHGHPGTAQCAQPTYPGAYGYEQWAQPGSHEGSLTSDPGVPTSLGDPLSLGVPSSTKQQVPIFSGEPISGTVEGFFCKEEDADVLAALKPDGHIAGCDSAPATSLHSAGCDSAPATSLQVNSSPFYRSISGTSSVSNSSLQTINYSQSNSLDFDSINPVQTSVPNLFQGVSLNDSADASIPQITDANLEVEQTNPALPPSNGNQHEYPQLHSSFSHEAESSLGDWELVQPHIGKSSSSQHSRHSSLENVKFIVGSGPNSVGPGTPDNFLQQSSDSGSSIPQNIGDHTGANQNSFGDGHSEQSSINPDSTCVDNINTSLRDVLKPEEKTLDQENNSLQTSVPNFIPVSNSSALPHLDAVVPLQYSGVHPPLDPGALPPVSQMMSSPKLSASSVPNFIPVSNSSALPHLDAVVPLQYSGVHPPLDPGALPPVSQMMSSPKLSASSNEIKAGALPPVSQMMSSPKLSASSNEITAGALPPVSQMMSAPKLSASSNEITATQSRSSTVTEEPVARSIPKSNIEAINLYSSSPKSSSEYNTTEKQQVKDGSMKDFNPSEPSALPTKQSYNTRLNPDGESQRQNVFPDALSMKGQSIKSFPSKIAPRKDGPFQPPIPRQGMEVSMSQDVMDKKYLFEENDSLKHVLPGSKHTVGRDEPSLVKTSPSFRPPASGHHHPSKHQSLHHRGIHNMSPATTLWADPAPLSLVGNIFLAPAAPENVSSNPISSAEIATRTVDSLSIHTSIAAPESATGTVDPLSISTSIAAAESATGPVDPLSIPTSIAAPVPLPPNLIHAVPSGPATKEATPPKSIEKLVESSPKREDANIRPPTSPQHKTRNNQKILDTPVKDDKNEARYDGRRTTDGEREERDNYSRDRNSRDDDDRYRSSQHDPYRHDNYDHQGSRQDRHRDDRHQERDRPPSRSYRDEYQSGTSRDYYRDDHGRYREQQTSHYRDQGYRDPYGERYDRPRSRQEEESSALARQGYEQPARPSSRAEYDRQYYDRSAYRSRGYEQDYYQQQQQRSNYYDDRYHDYYSKDDRYYKGYMEEMGAYNKQYDNRSAVEQYDDFDRHSQHSQSRGSTPSIELVDQSDPYYGDHRYSQRSSSRQGYYDYDSRQGYSDYQGYYYDEYGRQYDYQQETSTGRITPAKFNIAHVIGTFDCSGQFVKVLPNRPSEGETASVEIHELQTFLNESNEREDLQAFCGPLIRDLTHKNDVSLFCREKAKHCHENIDMVDRDSAELLWKLLELLIKQNGTVVGTDIASLLLEGHEPSTKEYSDAGMKISQSNENLADQASDSPVTTVTSDRTVISRGKEMSVEDVTDRFRHLLLYGRKKDALEWGMKHNLWGHALFLASKMDSRSHANVMTRFANSSMRMNDPLQTLYQMMSNRQPAAVTCIIDEKWGDWRPHLAMILSNHTHRPELDRKSITTLADSLATRGYLYASHFCYLMAQVDFGSHTKKTSKVALLGSNHTLPINTFATNEAIQCTEVYEYAQSLANPSFSLRHFQTYKFLYACRLAEHGFSQEALQYCEVIASRILQSPSHYSPTLVKKLHEVANRLKYHDPERLHSADDMEDPTWLQQLAQACLAFDDGSMLPVSGSVTPAYGLTTASSESSDVAAYTGSADQISGDVDYTQESAYNQQPAYDQAQPYQQNVYDAYNQTAGYQQGQQAATDQVDYNQAGQQAGQYQGSTATEQGYEQQYAGQYGTEYNAGAENSTGQEYNTAGYAYDASSQQQTGYAHDASSQQPTIDPALAYNANSYAGNQADPAQTDNTQSHNPGAPPPVNAAQRRRRSTRESLASSHDTVTDGSDEEDTDTVAGSPPSSFDYFGQSAAQQIIPRTSNRPRTISETSSHSTSRKPSVPSAPDKKPQQKSTNDANKKQSSGWFGGFLSKFKPKNEMKLPPDDNPSIVWDAAANKWKNVDGTTTEEEAPAAPPPRDMDMGQGLKTSNTAPGALSSSEDGAPPTGNRFAIQRGRGARSQYVDVLNTSKSSTSAAPVPSSLFSVMPSTNPAPQNIFVPSGAGSDTKKQAKSVQPVTSVAEPTETAPPSGELSRTSSMSSLSREVQQLTTGHQVPDEPSDPPATGPVLFNPAQFQSGQSYGQPDPAAPASSGIKYGQRRKYPK